MTEKNFQETDVRHKGSEDLRKFNKNESFHPHLQMLIGDMMSAQTSDDTAAVPLKPKVTEDPFYMAQLRARELENLQKFDCEELPIETPEPSGDESTLGALLGYQARDELNGIIPLGLRERRLAFSTFTLTALEHPSLKQYPLNDDEIEVTGLFNGFRFDTYGGKDTIIVPLLQPWIRTPRFLRGVELSSAKIPVLSIDDWKWTIPRN